MCPHEGDNTRTFDSMVNVVGGDLDLSKDDQFFSVLRNYSFLNFSDISATGKQDFI